MKIDKKNKNGTKILSMYLGQVKANNTSENLISEIQQIIYSLHQAKKNTKNT